MRPTNPNRPTEGFCIKLVILVNLSNNGYRGLPNCKCIYFATYLANWEVYFPNPGPLNITYAVGPSGVQEILQNVKKNQLTVWQYLQCRFCTVLCTAIETPIEPLFSSPVVCNRCDGWGGLPGLLIDVCLA